MSLTSTKARIWGGARFSELGLLGVKNFSFFPLPPIRLYPVGVPGFARISYVVLIEAGVPLDPLASAAHGQNSRYTIIDGVKITSNSQADPGIDAKYSTESTEYLQKDGVKVPIQIILSVRDASIPTKSNFPELLEMIRNRGKKSSVSDCVSSKPIGRVVGKGGIDLRQSSQAAKLKTQDKPAIDSE
jgi:hypothetical protein